MSKNISLAAWEPLEMQSFNQAAGDAHKGTKAATLRKPALPAHIDDEFSHMREATRQVAFQEGYESGHSEGLLAGHAEARESGKQLAQRLGKVISRFDAGVAELEHTVADELLALALEIARKITHETVKVQPEFVLNVIHDALRQLPLLHATIHLHPEDAALVREHSDEQLIRAGHRVLDDPHLERGDVVIEAGGTNLDARLATRWQRVIAALDQDASWLAEDEQESP